MTEDGMRAFEGRLVSALSSAVQQMVGEMHERMQQAGMDAVNAAMRNIYEQMVRTADAAEQSYEHVKQIGAAMQSMQTEFTTWREGVRAEVGNVRADVIQLRIEHDRCPHCNQRLAANGQ